MPAKIYHINLTAEEREHLLSVISKGKSSARTLARARVLLLSDEGQSDEEIVGNLHISIPTVHRIRKRYCLNGLNDALYERPRKGASVKLDGKAEAILTAIACSTPPEGHARWTLRLLADKAVELKLVDSISHVTVGSVLKKTNSSPGRKGNGQ